MAYYKNNYMYETSPRKLKPEYNPPTKKTNKREVQKKQSKTKPKTKTVNKLRKNKIKCVFGLIIMFSVLFTVSYRNAQISENYTKLKNQEKELSTLQKENGQLKVAIENSLNLGEIEQKAKEELGMQKATTKQTRYVNLPKKDYIEVASEQIDMSTNENLIERIYNFITKNN